jgi:hypothetical protein
MNKIISITSDIALLPVAGAFCLIALYKNYCETNFDPSPELIQNNPDEIPILLIHGSAFNETQFLYGRY